MGGALFEQGPILGLHKRAFFTHTRSLDPRLRREGGRESRVLQPETQILPSLASAELFGEGEVAGAKGAS